MSGARQRVVFMGSPDFAVPSLDALCEAGRYRPALVVSQPDRPRGRGQAVCATAVRARAQSLGIDTVTMDRASYADGVRAVAAEKPDIIVVVAFGMILRRDLLDLPGHGCVNVHASLLPRHRGVSPIQAAILAGDAVTGCTTMLIDEGVDTGDILLQEQTPVNPDDTAGTLFARLAEIGAGLLIRTLDGLVDGSLKPVAQDDTRATATRKIKKSHGAIDWTLDAAHLARLVRAMSPWPSAFTTHDGKRLIVEEAVAIADATGVADPGCVVTADPLVVGCGAGLLAIRRLRPEGRRAMTPREYAAGHRIVPGTRLGADDAHR